jgi:hypothetical protein
VSTGLALVASSDADAYADRIAAGETLTPADRDAHNAAVDRYERWAGTSYVLYGGAAALGATALLLYLFDDPDAAPRRDVTPGVVAGGLGVSVTGRF